MATQLTTVAPAATLTERVTSSLRAAIVAGELRGGKMYSVGSVAGLLGVSRTPVREAVLHLAGTGLVEIHKNQGFVVVERSAAEVEQIFQIRTWLEVPAAGVAATAANDAVRRSIRGAYQLMIAAAEAGEVVQVEEQDARFHAEILAAAGNQRLVAIVNELRDLMITQRHTTTERGQTLLQVAHDHDDLLAAVLAGEPSHAEAAMAHHLAATRDGVIALLRATP